MKDKQELRACLRANSSFLGYHSTTNIVEIITKWAWDRFWNNCSFNIDNTSEHLEKILQLKKFTSFWILWDCGQAVIRWISKIKNDLFSGSRKLRMIYCFRRSGQNFNNDLHERNYRSWNVKMRDLALNARPPSPNPWNKKSKKKNKVPTEPKSCPVLDTLIDEHYNFESRLSKLPIEIIETVYSHVVNIWAKHIETRGIFASIVSKVKFPKPQGINVVGNNFFLSEF